jgi:hypothetical protein
MGNTYILTGRDIVGLLAMLAVFVIAPTILMWCLSRRPKPRLKECPHCGAQNRESQTRCYCCGFVFKSLSLYGAEAATLIQRVKQADDAKMRRDAEAQATEAQPSEKTP